MSVRAKIIRQEITKPVPGGYMENKELTEIDRRLISTSRALLGASRSAVTQVSKGQFMIFDLFNNIWNYNKQLFKQLSEVRKKNDQKAFE